MADLEIALSWESALPSALSFRAERGISHRVMNYALVDFGTLTALVRSLTFVRDDSFNRLGQVA